MLIHVDVDSTLYDFDGLCQEVAKDYGVAWIPRSPSWFQPEEVGSNRETFSKIFRTCHSKEYVMTNEPYEGAAEVLEAIVGTFDDVEIIYVSDRNQQQNAALREWLGDKGFLHTEDQHVVTTKDKRHWMRERRPEIVIDDRVRTLLMARFELGSYGVTIEQPHNINLKNEVDKIYVERDWWAIGERLKVIIPEVPSVSRTKETIK